MDVLGNDTLGVTPTSIASTPAHGSVSCATTCTYTPDAGFSGQDSFDYAIVDANGRTSTATVTITVTPAPATSRSRRRSGRAKPQSDVALHGRRPATAARELHGRGGDAHHAVSRRHSARDDRDRRRPRWIGVCIVTGSVITCSLGSLAAGSVAHITWSASGGRIDSCRHARRPRCRAVADHRSRPEQQHVTGGDRRREVTRRARAAEAVRELDGRSGRRSGPAARSGSPTSSRTAVRAPPARSCACPRRTTRRSSPRRERSSVAAAPAGRSRSSAPGSSKRFTVVLRVDVTAPPGTLRSSRRREAEARPRAAGIRWSYACCRDGRAPGRAGSPGDEPPASLWRSSLRP